MLPSDLFVCSLSALSCVHLHDLSFVYFLVNLTGILYFCFVAGSLHVLTWVSWCFVSENVLLFPLFGAPNRQKLVATNSNPVWSHQTTTLFLIFISMFEIVFLIDSDRHVSWRFFLFMTDAYKSPSATLCPRR